MKIIIGYTTIMLYVFIMIFVFGPLIKKKGSVEISRKLIHISLFMVWILIDEFFKNSFHQIIIPIIFIVFNSISYKTNLFKSIERQQNNHKGTIYFAIAITIIMGIAYFFKYLYLPTGIAAFCLTIGDGMAALVGYNTHSKKIYGNKSLYGFISCLVSSIIALLAFRIIYWNELSLIDIIILSSICAIMELTEKGFDNFTITFAVFGICSILKLSINQNMYISIILSIAVFFVVFFSKAIDYHGSLLSMIIVFCFCYFGRKAGILFLLGTYFSIFVINKCFTSKLKSVSSRGFTQILYNGGIGALLIVIYGFTAKAIFLIMSLVSIGGCFIDSVSSDIGKLSNHSPYDFIHRVHVPTGLSGGITALGTISALLFSILIGVYVFFYVDSSLIISLIFCILTFSQTIIDSIIGAIFQVKYKCKVCDVVTEQNIHCLKRTVYFSGVKWIDNNLVNLFSTIIITSATGLIMEVLL